MMISIIIPTYNRAAIIKKTLDSVANQTFKEWECIVVDDHSTDNTHDIIDAYTRTDPRFKYMKNEQMLKFKLSFFNDFSLKNDFKK